MKLLIVDDYPINRKLLRAILEAQGHDVIEAADGLEALAALERETADAVISDILMPNMDGYRFCYELRKHPRLRNLPFVFYTNTYLSPADEKLALDLGADRYLRKPASAETIDATLRQVTQIKTHPEPVSTVPSSEVDVLKKYSEQLINKLEEKNTELTRITEELLESQAKLQHLLSKSPAIIYAMQQEGGAAAATSVSENIERMTGYTVEEALQPGWWFAHVHPDDALRLSQAQSRLFELEQSSDEYQFRCKDGTYRWLRDERRLIRDTAGQPMEIIGSWTDITEQRQQSKDKAALTALRSDIALALVRSETLRETLQQSVEALVRHLQAAFARIWTLSKDGSTLEMQASAGMYTHIDGPHGRVPVGQFKIGLIAQEQKPHLTNSVIGDPRVPEQDWAKREGLIAFAGYPLLIGDRLIGVMAMFSRHPLSEFVLTALGAMADEIALGIDRKRAEAVIRDQARLLDLARDGIMVRDLDDTVQFWNRGAEALYGWKPSEVLGRKITELIYEKVDAFEEAKKRLLASGEWQGELHQITQCKKRIIVNSRWTLLRDTQGAPQSVLVINTDITEQKRLEGHVLRGQRIESIGTLASGIAHDLNNILAPIVMSVQILSLKERSADEKKLLDTIDVSAQRGADVVRQILTFARGIEGSRVSVQLGHLIKDMVKIMKETFPKNITITPSLPRDLWPVTGDATQLQQVLLNLCVNARDAMPQGGLLTLAVENVQLDPTMASNFPGAKPGPYVVLTVNDSGAGIPEEIIDQIFDPFFTTKPQGQGTGLGLSTVIGVVKSHGGFINVTSHPGRGTTFKVHLPASTASQPKKTSAQDSALLRGRGELILVVDDEEPIQNTVKMMLTQQGYEVLSASDGTEGVSIFASNLERVQLVITDMMMPYMDGLVVIRALKKMNPNIKVIAASGLTTGADHKQRSAELEALGVTTSLTKPFSARKLLQAVYDELHPSSSK